MTRLTICFTAMLLSSTPAAANFTLLHNFIGGANDGNQPNAGLMLDGSTLFGTTLIGGGSDRGTVFSVNTDGSDFTLLHEFAGGVSDGQQPQSVLTLSGSNLFGTTSSGGSGGGGTVFSINTDGTGYTRLHEFVGSPNDGASLFAGLTLSGSTLFGTTGGGGSNDRGTVFSINTDGTGYTLLREFAGGVKTEPVHSLAYRSVARHSLAQL